MSNVDFVAGPGTHELCQGYDYIIGETAVMAPHSYKRAGIKNPANELDIVELHDCFTITEICCMRTFYLQNVDMVGGCDRRYIYS